MLSKRSALEDDCLFRHATNLEIRRVNLRYLLALSELPSEEREQYCLQLLEIEAELNKVCALKE